MQQPSSATHFPPIGFIGAGRLAGALARHCQAQGLSVRAIASRTPASAQALAQALYACQAYTQPQAVVDACGLIFITTPDHAIASTVQSLHWQPGKRVVHCSGATDLSALQAAAEAGAWIGGLHPMQTFADVEVAQRSLPDCTMTIEAAPDFAPELTALALRLGARVNHLPPGMRPLYHAAAGYASQFLNVLFDDATRLWRSWGATDALALQALLPLAHGTLAAIAAQGPRASMPGPVSRGDVASVQAHVQALDEYAPDMLGRYQTLCRQSVVMAQAERRLDALTVERLQQALCALPPG